MGGRAPTEGCGAAGEQAGSSGWWWLVREAALLAAEEVQEVLADVPGGDAFRVGAVLDLVLSQVPQPASSAPLPD